MSINKYVAFWLRRVINQCGNLYELRASWLLEDDSLDIKVIIPFPFSLISYVIGCEFSIEEGFFTTASYRCAPLPSPLPSLTQSLSSSYNTNYPLLASRFHISTN